MDTSKLPYGPLEDPVLADLRHADARLRERAEPIAADDVRLSDLLHRPEWREPEAERRGMFDRHGLGIAPTRLDEHEAAERRDTRHIPTPALPPTATAANVRAELRSDAAARRMVARVRRYTFDKHGLGVEHAEPVAETERALQPREPRETPRGVPAYLIDNPDGSRTLRFRAARGKGYNGR